MKTAGMNYFDALAATIETMQMVRRQGWLDKTIAHIQLGPTLQQYRLLNWENTTLSGGVEYRPTQEDKEATDWEMIGAAEGLNFN